MKGHLLKVGLAFAALMLVTLQGTLAATAVTSGAWSEAATWGGVSPGTTVSGEDIIIPNGVTVTLDMTVTFSGLLNTFSVEGTLSSSSTNHVTISQGSLSGNGTIDIHRLSFGTLSSCSYTGVMTLNVLENSGSLLAFMAQATVSDSLNLEAGILTLSTGANLALETDAVIRRSNGSVSIGGGIFNLSNLYNVIYVGSSKTSGVEFNSLSVQNVYIQLSNNTQVLTLSSDLRVNSVLNISTGQLDISGQDLEIYGDLNMTAGTLLESNALSTIKLESALPLTSGFSFAGGSSVDIMTIDHSGTGNVKLNSALTIQNELRLNDGVLSLESGSTLTMTTGSLIHVEDGGIAANGGLFDGSAAYDLEYMAGTVITGAEFSGSGLNDVTINMTNSDNEIHSGGNVQINGHFDLVKGLFHLEGFDLILNGTIDQSINSLLKGDVYSELELNLNMPTNDTLYFKSDYQTLEKLTLNLTGPGNIVLGAGLTVANDLVLTSGTLDVAASDLTILQGGFVVGYDETNYILTSGIGKLKMHVASGGPYVVFPVGDVINYSPASIQQTVAGSSGTFSVNVFNGVYVYGSNGADAAASESLVDKTWRVLSESGLVYDMNLKLGWLVASEVNGFDRTDAYISLYDAPWDTYTSAAAVTGLNSTYEIERTGITSMGSFAVTDENSSLKVEEAPELVAINLYPNPSTAILNVEMIQATDQYICQITDMSGRVFEATKNSANQIDISFLRSGTYLLSILNTNTGEIVTKEFVRE